MSYRLTSIVVALLFLASAAGCQPELQMEYGTCSAMHADSVNGTHLFSEMFDRAGHRVTNWRWLSPRLREKADVIVWFSTSFDPPSHEVRDWLVEWLE